MVLITPQDKILGLQYRGKLGYSSGLGRIKCGYTKFGLKTNLTGIYSYKKTRSGFQLSKMKHYKPTNKNTFPQFLTRFYFRYAVLSWRGLTNNERQAYNTRARRHKMTGYNLFIRDTLNWIYANT